MESHEPDSTSAAERSNKHSFVEHFVANQQLILGYIASLVPNWQDAEDVFQRTSIVLWEKFEEFDPSREFLHWAYGVAFYEVKNFHRVAGRDRLCFNDELLRELADARAARPKRSERAVALQHCLQQLPQPDRQLMLEAYERRGSVVQMAERQQRSVQTLYNRLNGIRRKLLECIDRTVAEEGAA